MLADKLRAASLTKPPIFVGSVTKTAATASGWDTAGESLDVMSIAEIGDLVVISFAFDTNNDDIFTWNGMVFTNTYNGTGSSTRGGYVGYRFVEAGDSNPYVTGATWSGLSITASVFRNVGPRIDGNLGLGSFGMPSTPSISGTGRLRVYSAIIDGASVSDWAAPPNYTLAATSSYLVSSVASSTATAYRIQFLTSDSPTGFTGTVSGADGWATSGNLFE